MESIWKAVYAEFCRKLRLYRGIALRVILGGLASLVITLSGVAILFVGDNIMGQLMLVLGIGLMFAVTIDGWRRMFRVLHAESSRSRRGT